MDMAYQSHIFLCEILDGIKIAFYHRSVAYFEAKERKSRKKDHLGAVSRILLI
jgi:hypothetical protein